MEKSHQGVGTLSTAIITHESWCPEESSGELQISKERDEEIKNKTGKGLHKQVTKEKAHTVEFKTVSNW